jgi:hypothetical protein
MKAIFTKFHGPTNNRGARISASDSDGNRVSVSYPYELTGEACHRVAVDAFVRKMNWKGNLVAGGYSKGYVYVFVPNTDEVISLARAISSNPYALTPDQWQSEANTALKTLEEA